MTQIPITMRDGYLIPRGKYSTALSTRYYAWSGYDFHGQHTMIAVIQK